MSLRDHSRVEPIRCPQPTLSTVTLVTYQTESRASVTNLTVAPIFLPARPQRAAVVELPETTFEFRLRLVTRDPHVVEPLL